MCRTSRVRALKCTGEFCFVLFLKTIIFFRIYFKLYGVAVEYKFRKPFANVPLNFKSDTQTNRPYKTNTVLLLSQSQCAMLIAKQIL